VLDRRLQRYDFAGETPIFARLLAGAIEDLNLMVARDRCRATAEVVQIGGGRNERAAAGERLLVVLAGSVTTADGLAAHSGDAVHVVGDGPVWLPSASPASLLDVRLHQLD